MSSVKNSQLGDLCLDGVEELALENLPDMSVLQSREIEIPTLNIDSGQLSNFISQIVTEPVCINSQLVNTTTSVSSIEVDPETIPGQSQHLTIQLTPTTDIQDYINGFGTSSTDINMLQPSLMAPNQDKPWVEIVEQPKSNHLRFRYQCEGRGAGALQGVSSTAEQKTFPKVKVHGYQGPAVVVVSCVTHDNPPKAHPHNLVSPATVGRDGCKKGVCTMNINPETMTAEFQHLGVQCVRRKDIAEALRQRKEIRVDPYKQGFDHANNPQTIDLNAVKLCFQVFYEKDVPGKYTGIMDPVCSFPIFDAKAKRELQIMDISDTMSSCEGGKKIIILCEKVTREDIKVKFFDTHGWEEYAEFNPSDVHKQYAISFKTPRYKDVHLLEKRQVWVKLEKSNNEESEAQEFFYLPSNQTLYGNARVKRDSVESKPDIKEENKWENMTQQASPRGGKMKADPYSQVQLQGNNLVLGRANPQHGRDLINIPTYTYNNQAMDSGMHQMHQNGHHHQTLPPSSTPSSTPAPGLYTGGQQQQQPQYVNNPASSSSPSQQEYHNSYNINNTNTNTFTNLQGYNPVYLDGAGYSPETSPPYPGHAPNQGGQNPLSPEGFANLNIESPSFSEIEHQMDNNVNLVDYLEAVDNLSGKIDSGSMDLLPPAETTPAATRSRQKATKRNQKEAELHSGSTVVPPQLGRQQSSINTPNVSAQINTPDSSQLLSDLAAVESSFVGTRTINNLDM